MALLRMFVLGDVVEKKRLIDRNFVETGASSKWALP